MHLYLSKCGTLSCLALTSLMSQQRKTKIIVGHNKYLMTSIFITWLWALRIAEKMFVERKAPELCSNLQNAAHWSGNVLLFQQRKSRGDVHGGEIPRSCYENDKTGWNASQRWLQVARMVSSWSLLLSSLREIFKLCCQPRFDPTPEPGNSKGLDLVLDAHTDQVTSSVTKPFQVKSIFVACLYVAGGQFFYAADFAAHFSGKVYARRCPNSSQSPEIPPTLPLNWIRRVICWKAL